MCGPFFNQYVIKKGQHCMCVVVIWYLGSHHAYWRAIG